MREREQELNAARDEALTQTDTARGALQESQRKVCGPLFGGGVRAGGRNHDSDSGQEGLAGRAVEEVLTALKIFIIQEGKG